MVDVKGLSYAYEGGKRISFPDFRLDSSASMLLLGESGSGKTTLLHLVGGLLGLQQGQVIIKGIDLSKISGSEKDSFRGKNIGFIFQKNHLLQALTVRQNLLMAPYLSGAKQHRDRVVEVLSQLGMNDKIDARVQDLSHGQAQRVAIARAVMNKPQIILADEPTSALDDKNCERVSDLLLAIAESNGSCLLIATHDQRLKSKFANQIQLR